MHGFVSVDMALESVSDVIAVHSSPVLICFLLGLELSVSAVIPLIVATVWLGTVGGWVDYCFVLAAVLAYDVCGGVVLFGEVVKGIENNLYCCLRIV